MTFERESPVFGISQKKEQEVKEGAHWKASLMIPQCSGSLSSIFGKKAVIISDQLAVSGCNKPESLIFGNTSR